MRGVICFKATLDYFENILKTLLEAEGFWVRQSFKVNLTKQEKRDIGRPSIPRPEIDLIAFKASNNEVIALEAKSYLDSPGVRLADLEAEHAEPEGLYKLFTCSNYRSIVFKRLACDLKELGMIQSNVKVILGLAAGKVHRSRTDEIQRLFDKKGWVFWSPEAIKSKVIALADKGYENEPAIITTKILMR